MSTNETKYVSFDRFLIRVPLLSLNYIQSVYDKEGTSVDEIIEIFKDKIIREAIFLASPSLYEKITKLTDNVITDQKEIEKICFSATKYLMRMGSRCTPFGLFAGYCLGQYGDQSKIELNDPEKYYGHLRLDMNYLCALAMDLAKIEEIKKQIKFFPNTSIYSSGNSLRYVEYKYIKGNRKHFIFGVENSEYVQQVLSIAKTGATIHELANSLVEDDITYQEAQEFINEIIESQILVSDLEPSVTGPEFLDQIIESLNVFKNIDPLLKPLNEIKQAITDIRKKPLGISISVYENIIEKISKLETKFEPKFLFQTDLVIPCKEIEIKQSIANDVLKGLEIMNRLTPALHNSNLTKFRNAFYERYGDQEMPLSAVLDIESGIGYLQNNKTGDVSPLIDDLVLPLGGQESADIKWNAIQSFLLKKCTDALSNGSSEIEILDDDVRGFNVNWNDLPSTISTMAEIIKVSEDNNETLIYLSSAGGSSSANLLGRFCHSNSDLEDYVKSIAEYERINNQDVIFAEIVHLPESRTGNILLRPQLREFEIPYLAKSSVSKEKQIGLNDLYISVKNGRQVVLRSKSLQKEIIPRLSTAHNYSFNALPIYQFLCDLQTQDIRGGINFNWGPLANEFGFLPRVKYKNIILSKATWNFAKQDIDNLTKAKNDSELQNEKSEWREKFNLPEYVVLADGDNQLLLNLDNLMCLKTLLSLVNKRPRFQLKEFLFESGNIFVKRGDQGFTNQVVFSFYNTQSEKK